MCANPIFYKFTKFKACKLQVGRTSMTFGIGLLVFIKDKHIEIIQISI